MTDLLGRIMARYPRVGQRCFELAARCLAEEVAGLEGGHSLLKSEDDMLPGLAQAVRESGADLAEMACLCGVDPIELRRKLALGRVSELLDPDEVGGLSDQELGSKLQQAAREFGLEIGELLDEVSCPSPVTPGASVALPMRSRAVRVLWLLRCRMCRLLWPPPYRIDFTPYLWGEFRFPREPKYACYRCLPTRLADPQVQAITRLTETEIPKSPDVRAWSVAFAAIAVLVVSGLYVHGSGAARGTIPALPAGAAPTHLATAIAPASEAELLLVRSETSRSNPPATAPVSAAVAPASTAPAPSPITASSPSMIITSVPLAVPTPRPPDRARAIEIPGRAVPNVVPTPEPPELTRAIATPRADERDEGWYIFLPPGDASHRSPDPSAPFQRWARGEAFGSAEACEDYRENLTSEAVRDRDRSDGATDAFDYKIKLFTYADCVSATSRPAARDEGWYIYLPPGDALHRSPDPSAPFQRWAQGKAFDSAEACEYYREDVIDETAHDRDRADGPTDALDYKLKLFTHADCVSATDRRVRDGRKRDGWKKDG